MKVGVNYTPRRGWFHSWYALDLDEVRHDLDAIAGLGLDHVRIFPVWPILQPDRAVIRDDALADVAAVVSAAGERGLDVWVDALNGHLSSFDYLPAWVTSWHRRNLFTDPEVRSGQVALVTALAGAVKDLPGARGIGLGNEFSQFAAPRHPERHVVRSDQVHGWLAELIGAAEVAWPHGRHSHSFDDDLWFVDSHPFGPAHAVRHGAMTTVHSWVFGKNWDRYEDEVEQALPYFARYLLELAAAHSGPGRPVWLQEVGAPISHVPSRHAPDFLRRTLELAAGAPGLEAVTWWCSHDVTRTMPDFPELEYSLGLFDADGEVKPIGRELAAMVEDLRAVQARPSVAERAVVAVPADAARADLTPDGEVFAQWYAQARTGTVPALQLP
ncbi:glycoside hydrolase 5 family protein [Ruania rhizosphaerae]|uniref:glycoside hydrolase 5 family protein n=1 Tax=Ruania rhizosphaerae TaxID=1840413 RepID=UPI0013584CE8|nr:hypothetical protein [Ruania rhizosphaerae]